MKPPNRRYWRRATLGFVIAYVLFCLLMYTMQDALLYPRRAGRAPSPQTALENFTAHDFTAPDGLDIPYLEHRDSGPVLLYFHGNGHGLSGFSGRLQRFAAQHLAVMAMEYRGYANAPGEPNERAIVADALAFYDVARKRYPNRPIVLWGYSLGTGVAVQLAAQRPVAALVLEAPFSATVDVAESMYPYLPIRWLMRDQFLSRETIGQVTAPLYILHGETDTIVPIMLAERLYARANEPKQFHRYPNTGHFDLMRGPAFGEAMAFIRATTNSTNR